MGEPMDTHYKGHTIRVSAVRIAQTARWTVRAWITWDFPNDSGAHMIVHSDLNFSDPEEGYAGMR